MDPKPPRPPVVPPTSKSKRAILEHAWDLHLSGLPLQEALHQALQHAGYRKPDSATPTSSTTS